MVRRHSLYLVDACRQYANTRDAIYFSKSAMYWNCFAATLLTMLLAVPFSLLCEVPFMNIEKFLLFPQKEQPKALIEVDEKQQAKEEGLDEAKKLLCKPLVNPIRKTIPRRRSNLLKSSG